MFLGNHPSQSQQRVYLRGLPTQITFAKIDYGGTSCFSKNKTLRFFKASHKDPGPNYLLTLFRHKV